MKGRLMIYTVVLTFVAFFADSVSANYVNCDGVIRCASDSSTNNHYLPHPTDCSKSYRCKNGNPLIYTCPSGELFSVEEQKCVDASKIICDRRCIGMPQIPSETTDATTVETTTSGISTKPTIITTELPEVTTELPEVTTELPEVTTELPEVTTKLPEVTTELPKVTTELPEVTTELPEVTTELPEVTTKNSESQEIDGTSNNSNSSESSSSESSSSESSNSSESHETKGCDPARCPAVNGKDPVYLAHEDCTKFCVCDWGNVHILDCPSPLHFNTKLNVCDWAYNAGCQD